MRQQQTAQGQVTIVKEHSGNKTNVTAFDERKNVVYAHQSEFKIEQSGKVRLFTFFNRIITAGPNAGQSFKEPSSFIFRATKDRFIEVHGILDEDTSAPQMIIWERVAEEAAT